MPNQPKTKSRNVRIDDDLWTEARAAAKTAGSNISEVIRGFLQSYVDRNRAQTASREIPSELRSLLKRYDIAESSVVDWSTQVNYSYMWRSKLAWPVGGTYEAESPARYDDEMIARKATVRAMLTLVDSDRSLLERADSFEILPVSEGQHDLCRVTFIDRGHWDFFDKS